MEHPYFVYPLLEQLRTCQDPVRTARLKELVAANVGDPQALIALIGDKEADFRDFYPPVETATHSTVDTIDSFLSKFGGPLHQTPDTLLFSEEPEKASEHSEASEISESPAPSSPSESPEASDNSLERVKVLVKNRDYQHAIEILEAIYLNNPKKSIYFADQIRYIKKMMLNDSKKTI